MKKYIIYGLIILFLVGAFIGGMCFQNYRNDSELNDTITTQIEKYIIHNDSILRINDSINFKVKEITKTYEKTVDDIIRNNPHDDYNFFSTYIERYCGNDYSDTAQNSESNIR
jgi:hypothetical protein